jgi:hypothetical protein
MCISSNTYTERNYKFDFTKLKYSKTPEEEREEQLMVATAEGYLESLGIKIKTEYGYYRNTWDILKDFGEYLSKNNKYTLPSVNLLGAIKEEEP